jgi:hypothetical protein
MKDSLLTVFWEMDRWRWWAWKIEIYHISATFSVKIDHAVDHVAAKTSQENTYQLSK